jgi:nitrate reductase molybdenum cofactor assembly chaperone NarJ/NarW
MILECFAELLEYPGRSGRSPVDTAGRLLGHLEAMGPETGESANCVRTFLDKAHMLSPVEIEETYTATFELNPAFHLYAGFVLFGESYKRGALLVELKRELIKHEIELKNELPDFIPLLLRLVSRLSSCSNDNSESAHELVRLCVFPAVDKIVEGIKTLENPYSSLLVAVRDYLKSKEVHA